MAKPLLLMKHNIFIMIVGRVEMLTLGLQKFFIEELLFLCYKHITMKVLLLDQAILGELPAL